MCRLAKMDFEGKCRSRICCFDKKETVKVYCFFFTWTEEKAGELLCSWNGVRQNRW